LNAAAPRVLAFATATRSHTGLVRTLNEDRLLARPDLGLWAVADGMGGHQAGEVASTLVVDTLDKVGRFSSGYGYLNAVCAGLQDVNGHLVRRAARLPGGGVIGATVVALLVFEGHYACVWAGDSRGYRLSGGRLAPITRDHSVVQELVEAGHLAPHEARGHYRANIVTRAVGAMPTLDLDVQHGDAAPGDVFLLCSDGLTGAVEDFELEAVLGGMDIEAAADRLLALTLERGAIDNVSFVLVRAG